MIVFSFNDPAGRQNITWQGFTLRNYVDLWGRSQVTDPMLVSIAIATVSTVVATTFGTMIGLADPLPVPRPIGHEPADLHPHDRAGDHPARPC